MTDFDWRRFANCKDIDTELFFPESRDKIDDRVTRACATCVVRKACDDESVAHQERGVWGGRRTSDRLRNTSHGTPRSGYDVGLGPIRTHCPCGATVVEGVGHLCA